MDEGDQTHDVLASVFTEPGTTTIRPATSDDLPWLIEQVREFAKFNNTKFFIFPSEEKARAGLIRMMEGHFMRIAEKDGKSVGFIAAWWVMHPYNDELPLLSETFWWVAPEHRQGRAGLMLLDEFVAFAKEHVKWATFSLLENSPVNERVLLKRGFRKHETAYLLEIE
jgi:predicted N-acetyltransferase YhbS